MATTHTTENDMKISAADIAARLPATFDVTEKASGAINITGPEGLGAILAPTGSLALGRHGSTSFAGGLEVPTFAWDRGSLKRATSARFVALVVQLHVRKGLAA